MSNPESQHPNYVPGRGVLPESVMRAELDAIASGEPALTPEDMAKIAAASRKNSEKRNREGRLGYYIGKIAAKIVSGGTAKY